MAVMAAVLLEDMAKDLTQGPKVGLTVGRYMLEEHQGLRRRAAELPDLALAELQRTTMAAAEAAAGMAVA